MYTSPVFFRVLLYTLSCLKRTDNDRVSKLTPDYKPKMRKIWRKKEGSEYDVKSTSFTLISRKEEEEEEEEEY